MVNVYPFDSVIGPPENPLVNSAPPFAVGPIVIFSLILGPLVRIIELVPTEGPPAPTVAHAAIFLFGPV